MRWGAGYSTGISVFPPNLCSPSDRLGLKGDQPMLEICNPLLVANVVPASWLPCCGPGARGEEDVSGIERGR